MKTGATSQFHFGSRRRAFGLGSLALLALAVSACSTTAPQAEDMGPKPIKITLSASADVNGGAPLPVGIYVLRSPGTFQSLDYFGVKGGGASGDTVESASVSLRPGETKTVNLTTGSGGTHIGVAGGFRDIDSASWRSVTTIGTSTAFTVRAGRSSISIR